MREVYKRVINSPPMLSVHTDTQIQNMKAKQKLTEVHLSFLLPRYLLWPPMVKGLEGGFNTLFKSCMFIFIILLKENEFLF